MPQWRGAWELKCEEHPSDGQRATVDVEADDETQAILSMKTVVSCRLSGSISLVSYVEITKVLCLTDAMDW